MLYRKFCFQNKNNALDSGKSEPGPLRSSCCWSVCSPSSWPNVAGAQRSAPCPAVASSSSAWSSSHWPPPGCGRCYNPQRVCCQSEALGPAHPPAAPPGPLARRVSLRPGIPSQHAPPYPWSLYPSVGLLTPLFLWWDDVAREGLQQKNDPIVVAVNDVTLLVFGWWVRKKERVREKVKAKKRKEERQREQDFFTH